MNKYIIPSVVTLVCLIYITSLVTFAVVKNKWEEELNVCKGMNNTYLDEVYRRDEKIGKMEQEIFELRFNLESCESYHEWKSRVCRRLATRTVN